MDPGIAALFRAADRLSSLEVFGLSAVAKAAATVLTYPMLVVKSRLQAARKGDPDRAAALGVLGVVLAIGRREGLPGFYHGIGTKIFQSVLAAALLFAIKEDLKRGILRALPASLKA